MIDRLEHIRSEIKKIFAAWATPRGALYQEPERAGTPRGEPIGLSRKKFQAAQSQVLHFKSKLFSLADLAELSGVSAVQMRVWRTEAEFKKVSRQATRDFIAYLSEEALNAWQDEKRFIVLLYSLVMHDELATLFVKWNQEAGRIFKQIVADPHDAANYQLLFDNMSFLGIFIREVMNLHSVEGRERMKEVMLRQLWPYIQKVFQFVLEIVARRDTNNVIKEEGKKILTAMALCNWAI